MQILQYSPGQKATIFLTTNNSIGERQDGYFLPFITRIIYPDLSLAADFPQNMIKLDIGLYYFQFDLPTTASAVGSYFVDIIYSDADTGLYKNTEKHVICTAPFGNYNATTK